MPTYPENYPGGPGFTNPHLFNNPNFPPGTLIPPGGSGFFPGWNADDFWTRMDPGMGQLPPSREINPGDSNYRPPGTPNYPRPGHPNYPPPGDPRNPNYPAPGNRDNSTSNPPPPAPWFSYDYRLPPGLQDALRRGDYDSAYGQSGSSAEAGRIMGMGQMSGGLTRWRTIGARTADEVENVGQGGGLSFGGLDPAASMANQQAIGMPLRTNPTSWAEYAERARSLGLLPPEDPGAGWGTNG